MKRMISIAALAALYWSRVPQGTAEQVRSALCKAARDLAQPGHDCETGYGLAVLPALDRVPASPPRTVARAGASVR